MKCYKHLFILFLFPFLFISCQEFKEAKPSSSSREGEVLVIMPDKLWSSAAGDSLKYYLEEPVKGLGQYEPLFKVVQINKNEFTNTLKLYRNVLFINMISSLNEDKILTAQFDKWAKPQITLNLYYSSEEDLEKNISKHGNTINNYFSKEELKRKKSSYKNLADKRIQNKLNSKYNLNLAIPRGYKWSTDDDNFVWIRNETNKTSQSIWISKMKLPNDELNTDQIIKNRNLICKQYIPGPEPASYMKTADSDFLWFDKVKLNGKDAIRAKGLWDLEGDFMGGPFVNYTFQYQNHLIIIEGFVYAPGKAKHSLIKKLDAIIQTIEFGQ